MAAIAVILGGMVGFGAAVAALVAGAPWLIALLVWSLSGSACAAVLVLARANSLRARRNPALNPRHA